MIDAILCVWVVVLAYRLYSLSISFNTLAECYNALVDKLIKKEILEDESI
jgi:hypothetical protein